MLSYRPLNRRRYSTGKTLLIKLDPLLIGKITKIQKNFCFVMYVVSEIIIMKSDSFSLRLGFEKSN